MKFYEQFSADLSTQLYIMSLDHALKSDQWTKKETIATARGLIRYNFETGQFAESVALKTNSDARVDALGKFVAYLLND